MPRSWAQGRGRTGCKESGEQENYPLKSKVDLRTAGDPCRRQVDQGWAHRLQGQRVSPQPVTEEAEGLGLCFHGHLYPWPAEACSTCRRGQAWSVRLGSARSSGKVPAPGQGRGGSSYCIKVLSLSLSLPDSVCFCLFLFLEPRRKGGTTAGA